MLHTNGAYHVMCRFWVQSRIRTSVWGFTSTKSSRAQDYSVSGSELFRDSEVLSDVRLGGQREVDEVFVWRKGCVGITQEVKSTDTS